MKTKHTIICENCKHENVLYQSTCKECGHYLRSTVVNIDLWNTVWSLFEKPTKTIKKIIFAQHKNFLLFLLFFLSVKTYLVFTVLHTAFGENYKISFSILNGFYCAIVSFITILLFVKVITIIFNTPNIITRYKDNLVLTVYSFVPTFLAMFILTPIEYGIFGIHWFDYNPSPFLIKEATAYILIIIEILMLLWSLFLLGRSYFIQSASIVKTIGSICLFISSIFFVLKYIPYDLL